MQHLINDAKASVTELNGTAIKMMLGTVGALLTGAAAIMVVKWVAFNYHRAGLTVLDFLFGWVIDYWAALLMGGLAIGTAVVVLFILGKGIQAWYNKALETTKENEALQESLNNAIEYAKTRERLASKDPRDLRHMESSSVRLRKYSFSSGNLFPDIETATKYVEDVLAARWYKPWIRPKGGC